MSDSSWKSEARARSKELKEGDTFKLAEGANCFRILPSVKKGAKPFIEFRVHRDVGPDKAFLRCGLKADGSGECWLCKKVAEISTKKPDYADRMSSKLQMLVQVSKYDSETNKFSKPKPWWVPSGGRKSLSVQVLSMLGNPKRDYEDPIKGRNWNIERTGSGFKDTRYDPIIEDEDSIKVPGKVLELMKPLFEYVSKYSEAEQKAAYFGKKKEDVEEEEAAEGEEETEETTEDNEEAEAGVEDEEESEETVDTEEETETGVEDEEEGDSGFDPEAESEETASEEEEEEEEEKPKPREKATKKPAAKPVAKKLTKPAPKKGKSKK